MKAVISALALTSALAIAAPANAALTDYAFAGTLTDGTKFDGAFTFDDAKSSFSQFSNVFANVGGVRLNNLTSLGTDQRSYFALGFSNNAFSFDVGLNAKSNSGFKLIDLQLGALNTNKTIRYTTGGLTFGSGTISRISAAVPEPTTWALMILGFGLVGYAMRRQKAVVRFA